MKVHTLGYLGLHPAVLLGACQELSARVYDVRYSANSRVPGWRGTDLARLLGDRYRHVPAWGNRNYAHREQSIVIADWPAGLAVLRAETLPVVILLCACVDPATCHRTVLADRLRVEGFDVAGELDLMRPRRRALETAPVLPGLGE